MSEIYETSSLMEASFVYAHGVQLIAVTYDKGPRFEFENKDNLARTMAENFYEDASTPGRSLLQAFGDLRKEITRASQARNSTRVGK